MPNPYFEKDNNAFLIDAGELILIDTGIGTDEAFNRLTSAFAEHGYHIADISRILLTHKHLDHFGLVHRLLEHCNAEVFIHEDDWPDVAQFEERDDLIQGIYLQKLKDWGVPDELVDMLSMRKLLTSLGGSIPSAKLCDGDRIRSGGVELEVIHTPGHTQGSVSYKLGDWLFTGDHLLPTYTPNIGATEVTSTHMLTKYRASLRKIRDLAITKVYPGHGDVFEHITERVDEILEHHTEREEKIVEVLKSDSSLSIYEIALRLFGQLEEHHVLLGAGEVDSHLELLLEKNLVRAHENLYSLA